MLILHDNPLTLAVSRLHTGYRFLASREAEGFQRATRGSRDNENPREQTTLGHILTEEKGRVANDTFHLA
jgi:hypothetical protein